MFKQLTILAAYCYTHNTTCSKLHILHVFPVKAYKVPYFSPFVKSSPQISLQVIINNIHLQKSHFLEGNVNHILINDVEGVFSAAMFFHSSLASGGFPPMFANLEPWEAWCIFSPPYGGRLMLALVTPRGFSILPRDVKGFGFQEINSLVCRVSFHGWHGFSMCDVESSRAIRIL